MISKPALISSSSPLRSIASKLLLSLSLWCGRKMSPDTLAQMADTLSMHRARWLLGVKSEFAPFQ